MIKSNPILTTYLLIASGGALGSVARFWFSGIDAFASHPRS